MQGLSNVSIERVWQEMSKLLSGKNIAQILKFMDKEKWNRTLSIGFYPGLLFGARAYEEKDRLTYVFYIPFVDIALELPYNNESI